MARTYGHQWSSGFGDEDDGTWEQALSDLSPEQFNHGYNRAIHEFTDWPPTLPKFREICLSFGRDMNLPSFEETYKGAVGLKWFHPLVHEVYKRVGSWDMRNLRDHDLRIIFKRNYDDVVAQISSGNFEYEKVAGKSHQIENLSAKKEKPKMSHKEAMEILKR